MSDPHFKYRHPIWTKRRMQTSSGVSAVTFSYIPIVEVLIKCRREAFLYIKKKKKGFGKCSDLQRKQQASLFRESLNPCCRGMTPPYRNLEIWNSLTVDHTKTNSTVCVCVCVTKKFVPLGTRGQSDTEVKKYLWSQKAKIWDWNSNLSLS